MRTLTYSNNAQSTLASSLIAEETELQLPPGEGDRFPDISDEDQQWFPLTLISSDGQTYEIVRATSRDGDLITIERGQENTPNAQSFAVDDVVSLRMTKAAFDQFNKDGDLTGLLVNGLNLATQTNLALNPINLTLAGVNGPTDGMIVRFKPTIAQGETVSVVRISLNESEPATLSQPYQEGATWNEGDLRTDLVHTIQYSEDAGQWFLISPRTKVSNASQLSAGLVQIMLTSDAIYDPDSNPDSITGAANVPDRRSVSRIIRDFFDAGVNDRIPIQWRFFGGGTTDEVVSSSLGTTFLGGSNYNYKTFSVIPGGYLQCKRGNPVIRATEKITISGEVYMGESYTSYPELFVGPAAGPEPVGATGVLPEYLPIQQGRMRFTNDGDALNASVFSGAIQQGIPFGAFHGGHGRGHVRFNQADGHVFGRGSLILIAADIELTASAEFYMATRGTNDNPETKISGQGTKDANVSQAGGGMLILASNTLSIHADVQIAAMGPSVAPYNYGQYNRVTGFGLTTSEFGGASPGQIWHINLMTGEIKLLF